MWILVNDDYVNSASIVLLEEAGDGRSIIHLADGGKIETDRDIDSITLDTGTIIPASVGFELAWNSAGNVDREPIVSWRITGPDDAMVPMVPSGRTAWDALIYPCGKVRDRDGLFFLDVGAWGAALFEKQERETKTASMADA